MEWREGLRLLEVLERFGYALPAALVRLNDRAVQRRDWADTLVPDGAVLDVHSLVAGG